MRRFLHIIELLLALSSASQAQSVQVDSLGFETFEMSEGDTSYTMKKYFMAFLKEGPQRTQDSTQIAEIQEGHMSHMNKMAREGKICIAGPFGDDGEMRGVIIFNVPTQEEVEALVAEDPAVIAGRLLLEVHPWWAAKGSMLE